MQEDVTEKDGASRKTQLAPGRAGSTNGLASESEKGLTSVAACSFRLDFALCL